MSAPTLPSFMERAVAFFGKAEANHTAADAKIAALEFENAKLKVAATEAETRITALTGEVETAKAATVAKETEVTTLKAELETAKGKANAVIASQGLEAEKLPPLEPRATGTGDRQGTLTEQALRAKAREDARN